MRGARNRTGRAIGGPSLRRTRRARSTDYWTAQITEPVIDRKNPGKGFRHVLTKDTLRQFIAILPDWRELSLGLRAIVLAPGNDRRDGWHRAGVVAICAFPRAGSIEVPESYYTAHRRLFRQIGVSVETRNAGRVLQFSDWQIRAYQLTHVLLHELGHHHDRMTTKSQKRASRGESFAEIYALTHGSDIWQAFCNTFPDYG